MALPTCGRLLTSPLARNQNERRILAPAVDAIEKEFCDIDRIERSCGDEPADRAAL